MRQVIYDFNTSHIFRIRQQDFLNRMLTCLYRFSWQP